MTTEEHKQRHQMLHKAFDELLADFVYHNPDVMITVAPIIYLMEWSYQQTKNPTPDKLITDSQNSKEELNG